MKNYYRPIFCLFLIAAVGYSGLSADSAQTPSRPVLSAKSAIVVDLSNNDILFSKNPHLKLPPASTTKLMTVLIALQKLPVNQEVAISRKAVNAAPSKADLTLDAKYKVKELIVAALVASSNDAAIALAEAVSGSEDAFVELMNAKAKALGMDDTQFINATGLPEKGRKQYSTVLDLTKLMRYAAKDRRIDFLMGVTRAYICGSDGKTILLKNHNKMLWRTPKFVKGKTGWTYESRHTFVGTNYAPHKIIAFAMLSSKEPWVDIERLATFGLLQKNRN